MDNQTHDDCDHVHSQLTSHHLQIIDGDDLSTDETGNTDWRVPTRVQREFSDTEIVNRDSSLA